jgi:uncharacterized protein (DUF2252 family)
LAQCPTTPVDAAALLRREDVDRIPELLPLRYERMLATPFTFYRGSAAVMAADLGAAPSSGLTTQLCGDAHLSNFGVFATPERRLVFDLNDFDETLPGPFEWDVQRLAASIVLAGRDTGCTTRHTGLAVLAAMRSYRTAMRDFAEQGNLAVWYANLDVERALEDLASEASEATTRRSQKAIQRARKRDSRQAAAKLTRVVDGERRFISDPPLLVPLRELVSSDDAEVVRETLAGVMTRYRDSLAEERRHLLDQFHLVDVARKVVGVGSVGTRAWALLLSGRDEADVLLLQAKEAGASVLEPYCAPSRHGSAGRRVVAGQRLMQATSDIFLGHQETPGPQGRDREYYVRQLRDGKLSADLATLDHRQLRIYSQLCAWTLARAHARSGDRIAIAAYLGKGEAFDRALTEFAHAYADRVEDQHRQVLEASGQATPAQTATGSSTSTDESGNTG